MSKQQKTALNMAKF
ncbi:TPA: Rop family plasmid primer RNA-binding protein, partial [Klebsiella pneumoniae]|nr:Rop family plasmid primer RNA-binding protein [Klebsiella pneumoniae]HEG4255864.1 Rop family plasmid primer RNA-binding protein [Klebsiella pneumoniae]HEG4534748.1 Rop family plasmid primer RNA-binding protein [Klebsiella pneumoniae]